MATTFHVAETLPQRSATPPADATVDETELEGLRDAVLAPLGVPAHAAVSVIIAARTTDRFIPKTLV